MVNITQFRQRNNTTFEEEPRIDLVKQSLSNLPLPLLSKKRNDKLNPTNQTTSTKSKIEKRSQSIDVKES